MIEKYLLIGSLLLHPILSLILSWKFSGNRLFNSTISILGGISLIVLISLQIIGISFIIAVVPIVLFSCVFFSICCLIWEMIRKKKRTAKIFGIISSIFIFGGAILFGLLGTSTLGNKKTKPPIEQHVNQHRITVNEIQLKSKDSSKSMFRLTTILVEKEFWPFKKQILEKKYHNTFPKLDSNFKFDLNEVDNELIIKASENGVIIWEDKIKKSL
ncbi:hypothetical protein KEM09_08990 [Carboxylicivirga mesophila]|uniref:Uncharacterized protein n=1 Tax=Carboxylicivirga mesophila TaxID=1166478 RepID=A0ABS5K962_9BACT|nr:hypothetical protein [Carboxylicivirga mesophila]MBS2211535.1 hypothetical protein [Carboxylicivirga mesophila]